ncbi:MAG: AMP-binding protein [Gammaproteobacteria bacterium]|nr:AMP-binding protein [Gammaproteobacteria bacterium]
MITNIYEEGLGKCEANHSSLTPLGFLSRAADVYPNLLAVIDGDTRKTWSEVSRRCKKMASALKKLHIGKGDTVACLAPNSLLSYEAHFGVPMSGAVLNAINTRLDAPTIAFILEHGEAQVLLVDAELSSLAVEALSLVDREILIVEVDAPEVESNVTRFSKLSHVNAMNYDAFIESGDEFEPWHWPDDEWDAISLNYTSGTTGNPKGVVYHHRGAYLNAMSNIVGWQMPHHPVYLWTLPMFHCNGWCFPWTLAAIAGTSVCIRQVNSTTIYQSIAEHRVSHFCGAPIIMNMIINADASERQEFDHHVKMMTAAAPPPASVLASMEEEGFDVTHVYGLTETYGPAVICSWNEQWDELKSDEKAAKKSRQGVRYHALERLDVMDPQTMSSVQRTGEQMGESMFGGNIVMKGYLKNPEATREAFAGGWFHSGDLGVMHDDNYMELKDRSKDIIISGGENISSIEVENCLYGHPQIIEAAVVAKPHEKWGETPCAFVAVTSDSGLTEAQVIDYCRGKIAHFKAPRNVIFGELPKTSTGKIQKFKLREKALGV